MAGHRKLWSEILRIAGLSVVLVTLVVVFSTLSDRFFTVQTLAVIANQVPDLTVLAVGMTLILVIGGIDLSVGSVLALSAAVLGFVMTGLQGSFLMAVVACLACGAICGLLNGLVCVLGRIPSFIVTLGMLEIARGFAYLLTDSSIQYLGSSVEFLSRPLTGLFFTPAFFLSMAIVILGQWVLSRTVLGRYWVAIGTNTEAVRMSGINATPYSIAAFVLMGLLCGLAGLMQVSKLASVDPNAAIGLELSAIAACVIGGTSLMGGRGSVVNSFLGVLIIQVLQTGLAQVGASEPSKRVITGAVIVVAVLVDAMQRNWSKRRSGVSQAEG
jgi:ribose transport system permease protein